MDADDEEDEEVRQRFEFLRKFNLSFDLEADFRIAFEMCSKKEKDVEDGQESTDQEANTQQQPAAFPGFDEVEALMFVQSVVKAADEWCRDHTPAAVAASVEQSRLADARLFGLGGQLGWDDGVGRELRKLPERVGRLQQEVSRKEKQLRDMYDRHREERLARRRVKDRSVRTVEGYDEAWFTTSHEEEGEEEESVGVGGCSGNHGGGGAGQLTGAAGGAGGGGGRLGTRKKKSRAAQKYLLSAGERVSAHMGTLISRANSSSASLSSFDAGAPSSLSAGASFGSSGTGGAGGGGGDGNFSDPESINGGGGQGGAFDDNDEFGDLAFEPGLQCWRVENFVMVPDAGVVAPSGVLLRGNSYVVVSVAYEGGGGHSASAGGGSPPLAAVAAGGGNLLRRKASLRSSINGGGGGGGSFRERRHESGENNDNSLTAEDDDDDDDDEAGLEEDDEDDYAGGGGLSMRLFHWVGSRAPLDHSAVASFKCTELARRLRADMAKDEAGVVKAKRVSMAREAEGDESSEFLSAFKDHARRLVVRQAKSSRRHRKALEEEKQQEQEQEQQQQQQQEMQADAAAALAMLKTGEKTVQGGGGGGGALRYDDGGTETSLKAPPLKQDRPRLYRVCLRAASTSASSSAAAPAANTTNSLLRTGAGLSRGVGGGGGGGGGVFGMGYGKGAGRIEASLSEVEVCEASLRPEFVLLVDSGGSSIFVFRGFLSTTVHRAKAFEMAYVMRQERVAFMGKCEVTQVDQGDEPPEFWRLIPAAAEEEEEEEMVEEKQERGAAAAVTAESALTMNVSPNSLASAGLISFPASSPAKAASAVSPDEALGSRKGEKSRRSRSREAAPSGDFCLPPKDNLDGDDDDDDDDNTDSSSAKQSPTSPHSPSSPSFSSSGRTTMKRKVALWEKNIAEVSYVSKFATVDSYTSPIHSHFYRPPNARINE
jgi:hypothetical protein